MKHYSLPAALVIVTLLVGCSDPEQLTEASKDDRVVAHTVNDDASAAPPNIVLIMADDLGWGDVGYHGGAIATPAIDALAADGVRLNRFYTYPVCTQTRGALMSGQRMRTVGLLEPMPPWTDAGLPLGVVTLADHLQALDYDTWKIGKWHLGDHYVEQFPNSRGYDHFYGHLGGEINYETHVFVSSLDWQRNGESVIEEGYSTHLLTKEAMSLLESHPVGKPFFLDLSYNAPHSPLQAPASALKDYEAIADPNRRRYSAMVSEMDKGIANVIDRIRQREDADNTVVIFLSDNGGWTRYGASNGELKGGKATHYEGGIRVPAIVWWPATLQPAVRDQFVSIHDLMPTLLKLAGHSTSSAPGLVGMDIWGAVAHDEQIDRREPIVFAMMMPGRPGEKSQYSTSILEDDWKLIEIMDFDRTAESSDKRYQLVSRELYNVVSDPFEKRNLVETQFDKARVLSNNLHHIPMGQPIGFVPPPPDWTLGLRPSAEPDFSETTRPPAAEAAKKRSLPEG